MGRKWDKVKYELRRHFSDATAMNTFFTPIYAVMETQIAGMSNAVSINSRLFTAGVAYAGLASLTKLRDASKKFFGITRKTREFVKYAHDIGFAIGLVSVVKPSIYLLSGETDWRKIAIGTGFGLALNAFAAGPALHFFDVHRDLMGVEKSERMPGFLRKKSGKVKKLVAAGLLAASVGISGTYYGLREMFSRKRDSGLGIERVVEDCD